MTAARERTEGIPGGWRCPTLQQYRIPALHTSTSKNRNTVTTTFPLSLFFFFCLYLVICLSRCGLCSVEGLHVAVVGLSSVPRVVFLSLSLFSNSFFCTYHATLFRLDFLWWNPSCLLSVYTKITFFEEPLVFVSYLYLDVGEKQKQRRNLKRTNEGMLHLSLVLQYGFAEHGIEWMLLYFNHLLFT